MIVITLLCTNVTQLHDCRKQKVIFRSVFYPIIISSKFCALLSGF